MKFSAITALSVLGSNAYVAAYEIPNNKVIGKIANEYLEQDSEDVLSQECIDEEGVVEVCVVGAFEADPAWATRLLEAGETLIACTKDWTTDKAEWEACLIPYFNLLGEKCDLSALYEACGEEDVEFIADIAQDIEYATMIATESTFFDIEKCEEENNKVVACIEAAGEADAAWLSALESASMNAVECSKGLDEGDHDGFIRCFEATAALMQQKCDLTDLHDACVPSEIQDFYLDHAEDLELDMIATEVVDAAFLQEEPVDQCEAEWETLLTCVETALSDEAWAVTYDTTLDTMDTCVEGLAEDDEEGWEDCITPWFIKVEEKCDTQPLFAACGDDVNEYRNWL